MIPFPDPKLCPRTPGHKLYYKARRRFCKMKNTEKQGEHFCLHFLRGCAILLYTDECISPRAIVAQLDRAFGSDPEGQRFESSRSHQEKPRHIVLGLFFFVRSGRIRTATTTTAACGRNREELLGPHSDFSKPCQGAAEKSANATRKAPPKGWGEQSAQWAVAQCAVPNR